MSHYKIARARYVQQRINEAKKEGVKVSWMVDKLSSELFVNPRNIYRDLARDLSQVPSLRK